MSYLVTDYPLYPNATDMFRYFQAYAKHFDLYPCITFNVEVLETKRDDIRDKWLVVVKSKKDGKISTHEFDKVVLAHGFVHAPKMPVFEGQKRFEGPVLHSQDYGS
jgi:dimethylaniline monooxygenase (N-oxide forming)